MGHHVYNAQIFVFLSFFYFHIFTFYFFLGTATNMENTEHGNCEYEVNIIRSTLSKHSTNGKSFQLVLASSNDASPTQILEELHVQKVTRINSCSPSADIYGYQILSEKSNVEANLKTVQLLLDHVIFFY